MSELYVFNSSTRTKAGKGAARAIRRAGGIPAVLYGEKKEPLLLEISPRELSIFINQKQLGMFNHIVTIDADGTKHNALIRDVQYDVVKDSPIHVDFLRASETTKIHVQIPVHFINYEKSAALKRGAVLNTIRSEVEVSCFVKDIPESITYDLENVKFGEALRISDANLPSNVVPTIKDRDFVVATVVAPKGVKDDEEENEKEEATEE